MLQKFQDLEEERLDFTKSSLWSFANIASTVCVSDDASCEKVRLSLEDCDVEKDISGFIKDQGTGQEIPDPPKYINFCRGDINDNASETSEDGAYSVAQFQRTMNPVFRTSSPQPSNYSSHHDPVPALTNDMGPVGRQSVGSERKPSQPPIQPDPLRSSQSSRHQDPYAQIPQLPADIPKIPHNEYPMDGMTQFCRMGPPSERSSIPSPTRPESRDDTSDYSNPTSFSSFEPSSGHASPTKQYNGSNISATSERPERPELKQKRSGFFQNHSPFRRKSKHEKDAPQPSAAPTPTQRNTWAPSSRPAAQGSSPSRPFGRESRNVGFSSPSPGPEPEPVDPRANFQLNVGNNVFDVASPDSRKKPALQKEPSGELDPIAAALAELKGVTKQASMRVSADRYHGLATPAPPGTPGLAGRASPNPRGRASPNPMMGSDLRAAQRGTPPPSYDQPVSRLGAPQPAFTSKQMRQTTANYVSQKQDMFNPPARQNSWEQRGQPPPSARPASRNGRGADVMRATSPAPLRSTSPRPYVDAGHRSQTQPQPQSQQPFRATSPNPYGPSNPAARPRAQSNSPIKQQNNYGAYNAHGNSPVQHMPRASSPNPQFRGGSSMGSGSRPPSSRGSDGGMALQLAPAEDGRGSQRRPVTGGSAVRPTSQYYGADGGWAAAASSGAGAAAGAGSSQVSTRVRSQSTAAPRMVTKDGRPILHYCEFSAC